ncbi:TauD/TfdA family dioxygenase [Roseibium aggregatum]|uniref:TauD/TfdA family dioxygenase n=1 Tax=Roseibium aggregatum TaxID=187304 RepID=A0A939EAE1_9HYPH|nr:TauD/TfdA family dioxygenase [Roseibium aggregatum]MBN9669545.1 TauD/TfdA family dioxygenase [Roseibium aggregatum]
MTTVFLRGGSRMLHVAWPNGTSADFPFLWLRDNCPSGFHPQTNERQFDLTGVSPDIAITSADVDGGDIELIWNEDGHVSRYDAGWLFDHRPGVGLADPAAIAPILWRGDYPATDLPRGSARSLMTDDDALLDFLTAAKKTGLALVDGMADDKDAGMAIARRIGFLRETNFGTTFEVMSKPNPNNLAYTSHALPLHTDLANQELPPGFQFLHCLANDAEGGGSTFCDGFAIATDLRDEDPDAFELLSTTPVPFRFHDADYDIRRHHTVIDLDLFGNLQELHFNAHLAGIFDLPADRMEAYYRAYRRIMEMTRSDDYVISTRLTGGEMVIFDNRRILHGRSAFNPNTGFRHLRGCYVDRGEFDSRIRVLSRGKR